MLRSGDLDASWGGEGKALLGAVAPPRRTRLSEFDRQDTARCEENDKRKAKLGEEYVKKVEDKWGEKARVRGTVANRMNRANRANAAKPRWRTDIRRK